MTSRLAYVLDDEPNVGAFVCEALQSTGYLARQFSHPAPFYAEVKASPPDLIVLDLALGQSDAVEVIRHLDGLRYQGTVLLISGRDETVLDEITRIGRSHGLAMLPPLHKPFRVQAFKARLKEAAVEVAAPAGPRAPETAAARGKVDLEEALRKNWLELWYQPKVELKSFAVCGAEGLLRARHPHRGIVLPGDLLPASGDPLYQPLTRFVLERAVTDWKRFAERGLPLRLSLNVPASMMHGSQFVALIREYLPQAARFPGLIVELTEDEVIRDPNWVCEIATQLKLYNVAISIDDFGTAYSSLSRLRDVPCAEVKLDRSFVSECADDPLKKALCRTVIDLAHQFGAEVCAEGVERHTDLQALIEIGCDCAQGYLFAPALAPEAFVATVGATGRLPAAAPAHPAARVALAAARTA